MMYDEAGSASIVLCSNELEAVLKLPWFHFTTLPNELVRHHLECVHLGWNDKNRRRKATPTEEEEEAVIYPQYSFTSTGYYYLKSDFLDLIRKYNSDMCQRNIFTFEEILDAVLRYTQTRKSIIIDSRNTDICRILDRDPLRNIFQVKAFSIIYDIKPLILDQLITPATTPKDKNMEMVKLHWDTKNALRLFRWATLDLPDYRGEPAREEDIDSDDEAKLIIAF